MKMYEYVAWLKPTQKDLKNGEVEILTPSPKVLAADDDKQALRRAIVQVHGDLMSAEQPVSSTVENQPIGTSVLDRLEVCVREVRGI